MAADKQLIKNTLISSLNDNGAVVFALGDHYVQTAAVSPNEIYCEAVSHHYHSSLEISLESEFTKLGFHLEEGGNYSRRYSIASGSDIDKLTEDIVFIFEVIYKADSNLPFEISEL